MKTDQEALVTQTNENLVYVSHPCHPRPKNWERNQTPRWLPNWNKMWLVHVALYRGPRSRKEMALNASLQLNAYNAPGAYSAYT